jgi:thiol:disulfide interchange protein/DsbC/DsbD-like thiol-disulfide interchange protein
MRALKILLLSLLLVSASALAPRAFALSGGSVATQNVKARLVSEVASLGPGQSAWLILELDIRDGWHTYWRNPGDSGEATTLAWALPAGFSAGGIVWTTPHRFDVPPLVNYGYGKKALHLVQVTAPKDLKGGSPVALAAKASWLVCSDVCIPEDVQLSVNVPTSAQAGGIDPKDAGLFTEARGELPSEAPAATSASIQGDQLIVSLGKEWGATLPQIKTLAFFPYDEGAIEYAAPQILSRSADAVQLSMKVGYQPPKAGAIRGVLVATEQSGSETIAVPIEIAANFAGATGPVKAAPRFAPVKSVQSEHSLPVWILFALIGGLILNLMPCVFPVLSIKALNVVEQAKKDPAAARAKGLVFAAGVIASMLCLAALMLALRAGGEQIGWGFQLQSPLFVTFLVYLFLAVGLNLSGVFEIGGGLAGVGDQLTQGDSYSASFFTGVLATLVATPCSAPFMAPALGAALTQPTLSALCIFAALGAGIALPYVLLAFAPWMRRLLPKPGAWMDTLKQLFAFPVYATAAGLLWVLAQQTSSFGFGAAMAGTVLIGLAAWSFQKSRSSAGGGKLAVIATAVIALLIAIALPIRFANVAAAGTPTAGPVQKGDDEWQPYSAAKVAELSAAGKPLLVNFTAAWCLTCLVNERNAFADSAVQEIFRNKKVTLMKGDWTNRDPAITKALADFGRAGVPLYVVYNSKPGSEPIVLPQILTASVVESAFADAAGGM